MFKKFLENLMGIISVIGLIMCVALVAVVIMGGVLILLGLLVGGFDAVKWNLATITVSILFLPAIALLMTVSDNS